MSFLHVFWISIIVISFIAEAATAQLVSVWFMVGGVFSLIVAMFIPSIFIQISVFILTSITAFFMFRPILRNILKFNIEATNSSRLIGKTAKVTQDIDNLNETGEVTIGGLTWMARSLDGTCINKGELVKVHSISGIKLIVYKI